MAYFQLSRARDLDLGSGHTAYHHASLIGLYLHAIFHWNWRNFCGWTDIQTHVRTDRRLRPALLGRLCRRVNLKNSVSHYRTFHVLSKVIRYNCKWKTCRKLDTNLTRETLWCFLAHCILRENFLLATPGIQKLFRFSTHDANSWIFIAFTNTMQQDSALCQTLSKSIAICDYFAANGSGRWQLFSMIQKLCAFLIEWSHSTQNR